jgi:membrane-associated protein
VIEFLNGLNGTLATALICALLFVDEAGVPLPFAPNEALLLIAGLLIGTRAIVAWVFLPLALIALVGGMLAGYAWARALGDGQLRAVARRIHAEKAYQRASARLHTAGPVGIGLTRLLPGVRTYATLVAGAARLDLRRFLAGAIPALVIWLTLLTAVGAAVGLPAEHLLGRVDTLITSGVLLALLGGVAVVAIVKVRRADADEHALSAVPVGWRLLLGLSVDLGIVATLTAGVVRTGKAVLHPGHPLGRVNDLIVVAAAVVLLYIVGTRRGAGATLGEGLFAVDYRAALRRSAHREADHKEDG